MIAENSPDEQTVSCRCPLCAAEKPPECLKSREIPTWDSIVGVAFWCCLRSRQPSGRREWLSLQGDIYPFVDTHWKDLCGGRESESNLLSGISQFFSRLPRLVERFAKKKNQKSPPPETKGWRKSVQDTLSHSKLFVSGARKFGQYGLWNGNGLTDPWAEPEALGSPPAQKKKCHVVSPDIEASPLTATMPLPAIPGTPTALEPRSQLVERAAMISQIAAVGRVVAPILLRLSLDLEQQ